MMIKIAPMYRSRYIGALFGTSVKDTYYTVLKGCAMLSGEAVITQPETRNEGPRSLSEALLGERR